MAGPGQEHDHDEEVRFAVVLNGGVSLAIWMGGVTYEIDRLTRTRPDADSVYGRVLDMVQARARADVIAGTSAGGINGAFLALGQAYEYAELSGMRDLWASKGSFTALLRSPVRGPLPSLLRGDDYFLPELRRAFEGVVHTPGSNMTDLRERPVDLFLTTTIPEGQRRRFNDVLEQPIWEVEHTNRFTFSRNPSALRRPGTGDEFADADIHRQLALAARSTASFPGAFEPSFIPVGRTEADDLHPDMADRVDLAKDRYGIDGGVLLNKPLGLALQAIWKKRASTQVRRVLLYVNPDPGREPADEAEPRAPIPPLRDVLIASLTRLTLGQSIHEDLQELREANRRARDARRARPELLQALGTPERVRTVAHDSFAIYQDVRAVRAARSVANLIAEQDSSDRDDRVADQDAEQLRDLVFAALRRTRPGALPYVPSEADLDPRTALAHWSWGIAPLERLAAFVRDLLKRAIWLLPAEDPLCGKLKAARVALNDQRDKIDILRRADTEFWESWAQQLLKTPSQDRDDEPVNEWADQALKAYDQWLDKPTGAGTRRRDHAAIAERLAKQLPVVAEVARLPDEKLAPVSERARELMLLRGTVTALGIQADDRQPDQTLLASLLALLGIQADDKQPDQRLLGNLLAFEVCQLPLSGDSTDNELTADLVLISAHTPNRFATSSTTVQDKVTGLQLQHFGAFYKESWRVNDWIWGRVDAVTRLLEALLAADRLRQRGITSDRIRRRLAGLDDNANGEDVNKALESQLPPDLLAEVNEELQVYRREEAEQDGKRSLRRLHATAQAFAHQLHQQIVAEELDWLAVAVKNDQSDGASRNANGSRFLNHYCSLTGEQRKERALELFDQARIGAEPIAEEFGTDLFARTASTATAGIVGTVDDQSSGLGRLRAITRPIRGLTLVLYALLLSMTRGGFGAALVNLALAAGGALVAVSLFTNEPGWVTSLGAVLVLAGLFAAALRSRLWNLGLVVGPPLLFVVVFLLVQPRVAGNLGIMLTIVAIVVAASLLGMVREPARLPDGGYLVGAAKTVAWLATAAVVTAALYWLFGWVRTPRSGVDWRQVVTFLLAPDQMTSRHARDALVSGWGDRATWLAIIAAVVALVVVAVAISWAAGRLVKRRRERAPEAIMPHQEVSARWMPWYGLAFGLIATTAYGVALFGKVAAWQPAVALTALVCWALTTFVAPWLLLRVRRRANEVPPMPADQEVAQVR